MESIRLRAGSGGVPARTGQATGYSASGAVVSCAGSGQYVELQEGVAQTFTDNGDGTISDDVTGLMWEKISDDGSIHDKDDTYTSMNASDRSGYDNAVAKTSNFAVRAVRGS